MVGGGATPSIWNFESTGPRWSEIEDFEPIIARSASAVRPSEKSSVNTNRKSPTRFPTSLRWSSYVAPKYPKGGLKKAKRPFSLYNRNSLEESLLQIVSLCENCQRQSCRAFIGLTIHAKIIGVGRMWNFGLKWPQWSEIADFWSIFACSASAVTPSKKDQLSLIGSPLRAFQWAQDEHRTLSLSPQRVAQKRKVSKIWTISCNISETVWDRMIVTINH